MHSVKSRKSETKTFYPLKYTIRLGAVLKSNVYVVINYYAAEYF